MWPRGTWSALHDGPDLERAGLRGLNERGDPDRLVEVQQRCHQETADLLLRLGERAVGDDAVAVHDTDDLRVGCRRELAALHPGLGLPPLLEEPRPARHR